MKIGQIVEYYEVGATWYNGQLTTPGIVTRVWSPDTVDITIFPNCAQPECKTSVRVVLGPERQSEGYTVCWPV